MLASRDPMDVLNRSYFPPEQSDASMQGDPRHVDPKVARWLSIARGATPAPGNWEEHNGGIVMPRRVHLAQGVMYYRFASGTRDRAASQFGGVWWIEHETLVTIANFSRQYSSPRDAVRYLLAVPWEWSAVDKLVGGILTKRLDAYKGKGRTVRPKPAGTKGAHPNDRGGAYAPPHHLRICQLCIPGLYDPELSGGDAPDSIRLQAFPKLQIEDIWKSKHFR